VKRGKREKMKAKKKVMRQRKPGNERKENASHKQNRFWPMNSLRNRSESAGQIDYYERKDTSIKK
jgi:hypothetical protein